MTIRAVAFDAYGTLFDVYAVGTLAEEIFPGHGARLAEIWRERQIAYTWIRTLSDRYAPFWQVTGDALAVACEQLDLELTPSIRERLMGAYASLTAYPENREALAELRSLGLSTAILTNGNRDMIDKAIASAGLGDLLDHVLSVEAIGRFKTAPEAYALATEAFACPASEILFVSSNGWDVCGATWFGFTTFWLNRAGGPFEMLGVEPAATGRKLSDVVVFARDGL